MKCYVDLSVGADVKEAVNKIYDVLRWAELRDDAKCVLIINLKSVEVKEAKHTEHLDALFDRIFRATSGKEL